MKMSVISGIGTYRCISLLLINFMAIRIFPILEITIDNDNYDFQNDCYI